MNFTFLFIIAEYVIVTYAFGLMYKFVGKKLAVYIQRNFGWTGYCVLGSVGVTFHELSHLVTAIIFRHKINEVKLFRPFQSKIDGTLGYVNHSWNSRSIYQKVGNFFIGTAPMFFGAGLMFVLLRIAFPYAFAPVTEIAEIPRALVSAFGGILNYANLFSIWTLILFFVSIFICPYMHMSWADIKGATSGAVVLVLIAAVLSVGSVVIPQNLVVQIQTVMNTFVTYYVFALVMGLIVSVAMAISLYVLSLIRGK
ncbi:MAG: hypothetical protein FWB96_12730 [Defluviitaleaceae bacterium]|nr:hypothetical protein [Defluviitaleaceae bacterium]MCL2264000.1 hypothetical protein [Defluviitaleaceae bacterium]